MFIFASIRPHFITFSMLLCKKILVLTHFFKYDNLKFLTFIIVFRSGDGGERIPEAVEGEGPDIE
jgi:hypothetical protein